MKMYCLKYAGWLCFVVYALFALADTSQASDVRHLWQSREQFVALDRQELRHGDTAISNDHPVEIAPERLSAMLASIEIRTEDNNKPEQLINNESLEVLVPQMMQGFRQAAPGEDVTFAIIGLHKAAFGLAKSPKVTTGRAFYKAGKLNIIFGLVRKDVNERVDRRLEPFTPGSRYKILEGEWTLVLQPGRDGYSQVRKDWVTFSNDWQMPAAVQNVPLVQTTPALAPHVKSIDTRSPADRLSTLNELKHIDITQSKREVVYSFGAGEALLLDRINPGWKDEYFKHLLTTDPLFPK